MVFSTIHPGMLHDSSYTTVTSRGPPRKMRHLPWSVHLRRRNPRQRPVVSWPSRGENHENWMFRCISTLFWLEFRAGFWGVDLPFKNRGPIKVSGRWWFKMFFFWIWQAETWGSELARNYLEPALSGFWRGRKKGSFQQRAWRGSELRNCSGVRIWPWSSSTKRLCWSPTSTFYGRCHLAREMPPRQEIGLTNVLLITMIPEESRNLRPYSPVGSAPRFQWPCVNADFFGRFCGEQYFGVIQNCQGQLFQSTLLQKLVQCQLILRDG